MALSINPSYRWEGLDGPWSTFDLRVGTPPQLVRVLPSTSGSEIWVVHPQGCNNKSVANCGERRGGLFHWNSSTTFEDLSTSAQEPYFQLNFNAEEALGYNGSALVGVDTVALGGEGDVIPALQGQVVAVYAVAFPFMGLLGLKGRNATIVDENDQHHSVLGALKANGEVKTESWAYTAGAPYRPPQGKQYGSLTFGGWDRKRGDLDHGLTIPFGSDQDLLVSIASITIDTVSGPVSVGGLPISAHVDTMIPDLWLPAAACSTFESAFSLVWNETQRRYRVSNDTQRDTLRSRNPNVTLGLAVSGEAGAEAADIVLPYLAFDLTAETGGGYFPLRRAEDGSQYFIGRTFLQEAYLAVDYLHSEFTIAQARFPAGNNERDIVVFLPHHHHHQSSGKLSTAAIAGICVGAIAAVAVIFGRLVWLWQQKRRARERRWGTIRRASLRGPSPDTIRGTAVGDKSDDHRSEDVKPELDANGTARFVSLPRRHELEADADVRTSEQSLSSDGGSRSSDQTPAELDGTVETLVGASSSSSTAVSPLRASEISLSPLPLPFPLPAG